MATKAHCYFQVKKVRKAWKSLTFVHKKCSDLSMAKKAHCYFQGKNKKDYSQSVEKFGFFHKNAPN